MDSKTDSKRTIRIKSFFSIFFSVIFGFCQKFCQYIPSPWKDTRKRVYIDGIYDIYHRGHLESLKTAKKLFKGNVILIVGVISDKDATSYKREPIYNEEDRYEIIRGCRYVDEVIEGSPLIITKKFVKKHKIDYVVHGFSDSKDSENQKEFFKEISDIFIEIEYYKKTSTTGIIKKIQENFIILT